MRMWFTELWIWYLAKAD